jgi:hypothetical protein
LAKPGPTTTALPEKPGLATTAPPRDQAKAELGIAISAISAIILTAFIAHPTNGTQAWLRPGLLCLEFTTFFSRRQESDLKVENCTVETCLSAQLQIRPDSHMI